MPNDSALINWGHLVRYSANLKVILDMLKGEKVANTSNTWTIGQWLTTNGKTSGSSTTYVRTDYIAVKEGEHIYYKLYVTNDCAIYGFYPSKSLTSCTLAQKGTIVDSEVSTSNPALPVEGVFVAPSDGYVIFTNCKYYGDGAIVSFTNSGTFTGDYVNYRLDDTYSKLHNEIGVVDNKLFPLENEFIPNLSTTWTIGQWLGGNGKNTGNSSTYVRTDFIPVSKGDKFYYNLYVTNDCIAYCFYTSASLSSATSQYLSGTIDSSDTSTTPIPMEGIIEAKTDGYVIFTNCKYYGDGAIIKFNNGTFTGDYIDYRINDAVNSMFVGNSTKTWTIWEWLAPSGKSTGTSPYYVRTDYIPVKRGDQFYYKLYVGSDCGIYGFYTDNEDLLNCVSAKRATTKTEDIEEGIAIAPVDGYVIFSNCNYYGDGVVVKLNSDNFTENYINYRINNNYKLNKTYPNYSLTQGVVSESTWTPITTGNYVNNRVSTTRIHIPSGTYVEITVPSGIQTYVYDIGRDNVAIDTGWLYASGVGTFRYKVLGESILLVFKDSNGANITPDDLSSLIITKLIDPEIDTYTVETEGGSLSNTYGLNYSIASHRSDYRCRWRLRIKGYKFISLGEEVDTTEFWCKFYDSDNVFISSIATTATGLIAIPSNAEYVLFGVYQVASPGKVKINMHGYVGEERYLKEAKRCSLKEINYITYDIDKNNDLFTTTRLMLPPNYDPDSDKPVPLILFMDGSGNFINWDGVWTAAKQIGIKYLANEGFAVLTVFAWANKYYERYGSGVGSAYPYPCPTNLAALKACVDQTCELYNVDRNNVHILSKSQGGQVSLYYASRNELGVKSIACFAPVFDYLSMPADPNYVTVKKAIVDDLKFEGDNAYFCSTSYNPRTDEALAYVTQNLPKFCQLNEAWTNLVGGTAMQNLLDSRASMRYFWDNECWDDTDADYSSNMYTRKTYSKITEVPIKVWIAKDDDNTPYWKCAESVEQIRNGGGEAYLVDIPEGTGGHNGCDIANSGNANCVSGTTALNISYTNVPYGWVEAVKWMRSKMDGVYTEKVSNLSSYKFDKQFN